MVKHDHLTRSHSVVAKHTLEFACVEPHHLHLDVGEMMKMSVGGLHEVQAQPGLPQTPQSAIRGFLVPLIDVDSIVGEQNVLSRVDRVINAVTLWWVTPPYRIGHVPIPPCQA